MKPLLDVQNLEINLNTKDGIITAVKQISYTHLKESLGQPVELIRKLNPPLDAGLVKSPPKVLGRRPFSRKRLMRKISGSH